MQTTAPDNLAYSDTSDAQNLPAITGAMQTSVQNALLLRQMFTYRWPNAAARNAQTLMRLGDIGMQFDTLTVYSYNGTIWLPFTGQMPWMTVTVSSQNISSATTGATQIAFNTIVLQRGDTTTFYTFSNNQITINVAGVYRIYYGVEFAGTASTDQGRRQGRLMVNGNTVMNADSTSNSTAGQGTTVQNIYLRAYQAGDIITCAAGLTSSVSPQQIGLPGTYLTVEYVGA